MTMYAEGNSKLNRGFTPIFNLLCEALTFAVIELSLNREVIENYTNSIFININS